MEHEEKKPIINFKIDDLVSTYLFILYRAGIKVKEVTFLEVERFGALLKEAYKEKGELVFDLRRDLTREFLSNHMDLYQASEDGKKLSLVREATLEDFSSGAYHTSFLLLLCKEDFTEQTIELYKGHRLDNGYKQNIAYRLKDQMYFKGLTQALNDGGYIEAFNTSNFYEAIVRDSRKQTISFSKDTNILAAMNNASAYIENELKDSKEIIECANTKTDYLLYQGFRLGIARNSDKQVEMTIYTKKGGEYTVIKSIVENSIQAAFVSLEILLSQIDFDNYKINIAGTIGSGTLTFKQ